MKFSKSLLFLYLILFLIFTTYFYVEKKNKEELHLKDILKQSEIQFNIITNSYSNVATTIFDNIINKEEITKIIYLANRADKEERDKLREKLYDKLLPIYESLKKQHIRQLHFHLPKTISFFRFHKPKKFGDDLTGIRYSIEKVNKIKKPIFGFEEGRVYNGYRHVYPLFYKDEFVGTVEISYSLNSIKVEAIKTFEANYSFMFKKSIIEKKVWESTLDNYIKSDLSENYLYDKEVIKYKNSILVKKLNKILYSKIDDKLATTKSFVEVVKFESKFYVVSFLPIANVEGNQVAYFISYEADKIIKEIKEEFIYKITIFSIILILFYIVAFKKKLADYKLKIYQKRLENLNTKLLREQELFNAGNVIVFEWINDEYLRVNYVSKSINQLGYMPEDFYKNPKLFLSIINEEDKNRIEKKILNSKSLTRELFEIDYRIKNKNGLYKWFYDVTRVIRDESGKAIKFHGYIVDITEKKLAENKLQESKKKIIDSIKYSSMIQNSILPLHDPIKKFLNDYFIIWKPKDIVGGDIYLFEEFEDGCLIGVIDCTGHGVAGALMSMVTKASMNTILNKNIASNPALILSELNKKIKNTLNQDREGNLSDVGLDGGFLFYDKQNSKVIFASAKTPLFYIQNNNLKIIKGDRESIGYKKSNLNFEFNNITIDVSEDTYFYMATDGLIDQNGGQKDFPFGKSRLKEILMKNYKLSFEKQKGVICKQLREYQGNSERNDDITMFGFKIRGEKNERLI